MMRIYRITSIVLLLIIDEYQCALLRINPDLSVCYSFVKMYTATVGRMTNSSRVISTKS